MQAYAAAPNGVPEGDDGEVTITMPAPHGDHFHVGNSVVLFRDATGLVNEGVWAALQRKGAGEQLDGVDEARHAKTSMPLTIAASGAFCFEIRSRLRSARASSA